MDWLFLHVGHTVRSSPFAMVSIMVLGGVAGLGIAFLPQILARVRRRPPVDTTHDDA